MGTGLVVDFACAAVLGYGAVFFALLFSRRLTDREYLAFSITSLLFAATELARTPVAPPHLAAAIEALACAAFIDQLGTLGPRDQRDARLGWWWGLINGVGSAVIPLVHMHTRSVPDAWADPWGADPLPRALTFATRLLLALPAAVLIVRGLFRLGRSAWREPPMRAIVASAVLVAIGLVFDMTLVVFKLDGPHLAGHAFVVMTVSMTIFVARGFARTADALDERTTELDERYNELRRTQEQLVWKEQLAAVGELSAVIAHEVRNPLAIIKNAVSGLRRATLRAVDRDTLLTILDEETDKLNRLVHDLLAYAQPVMPKREPVALGQLLRRSVARAAGGAARADIDVRYETVGAPHEVLGDEELLVHALVNVIDNAFQAMPSGGALTVATERVDLGGYEAVAISFIDTGEGMDTIVRSKARNPFFTTRPTGTGLGLAIVERVIRNHGGRVEIDSSHGVGTTVRIVLPSERTSILPIPPPEGGGDGVFGMDEVPFR